MIRKTIQWLLLTLALFAAGCGGGGGGGAAGSSVGLFITDDLRNGWQAVWVTVYKVELEKQGGGFATVFEDPLGKVINLRALNDGSPRYAFLGKDGVPEGTYTGIRFTLSKDVQITPDGSNNNLARVFDDSLINPSDPNEAILTMAFPGPKPVAGSANDLVADFVLSSWTENGTKIQNCIVSEGSGSGLNDINRHDDDGFHGTVSNLSGAAPDFTFTLNLRSGNSVTVTTNSMTSVFNSNGSHSPVLANGKRVEVSGKFDPATRTVIAAFVKIKGNEDDDDEDEVKGLATSLDAVAGTFDLSTLRVKGFVPTEPIVHVQTTTSTRFFSHGGVLITQAQFFEALNLAKSAEVEGTWNPATNVLTAVKAKIEDEGNDDHYAEAKGSPNTIDAVAGTFRIQLTEWEGFSGSTGVQVNIVTHAGTRFRNEDEEVTKEQFFTLLTSAALVKVEGIYENGTMTAKEARIRSNGGGGGGGTEAEVDGSALNVNAGAKSFGVVLIHWENFNGSAGMTVNVQMNDTATYRDFDGETISAEVFFSKLGNGVRVEAEGTYNSGTNTLAARKAKLED